MVTRSASASYEGLGKDGKGHISTQSEVLKDTPYGFNTRFENEAGTNPEELIAAAHAGCFTMALSFALARHAVSQTWACVACCLAHRSRSVARHSATNILAPRIWPA